MVQIRLLLGAVCSGSTLFAFLLRFVRNVRQLFAADDFSRHHFSDAVFLCTLRVIIMENGSKQAGFTFKENLIV